MTELSLDFVRNQFPAFQEPALRGVAHFDNASGTYACRYTIWRLHRFYREYRMRGGSQPGGDSTQEEMTEAHRRMAVILGVAPTELTIGPSTAQNLYVLTQAFREWLRPGAAIVLSGQDRDSFAIHWRRLAAHGVELRDWPVNPETGQLSLADLSPLLEDGKVRLVCFPHSPGLLGVVNDVAAIAALAHRYGAQVCVDGAHMAQHGLPDLRRLGADIYLFSAQMTWGPHQGLMVIRTPLGQRLPQQGHPCTGSATPHRFTPGGADPAQLAACAGIADYIDALYHQHEKAGRDASGRAAHVAGLFRAHERGLAQGFLDWVADRPDLRLLGPRRARGRLPNFSLVLDRPAAGVVRTLAAQGILAGGGDLCMGGLLRRMGLDPEQGVLRLSFQHYNSIEEVGRLVLTLDQLLPRTRGPA